MPGPRRSAASKGAGRGAIKGTNPPPPSLSSKTVYLFTFRIQTRQRALLSDFGLVKPQEASALGRTAGGCLGGSGERGTPLSEMVSHSWKSRLAILCMAIGILVCDADGRGTRGRSRGGGKEDGGVAVVGGGTRSDRLLIENIISRESPCLTHFCILPSHHKRS